MPAPESADLHDVEFQKYHLTFLNLTTSCLKYACFFIQPFKMTTYNLIVKMRKLLISFYMIHTLSTNYAFPF